MIKVEVTPRYMRMEGLDSTVLKGEFVSDDNGFIVIDTLDGERLYIPKSFVWEVIDIDESEGDLIDIDDGDLIKYRCTNDYDRRDRCEDKPCIRVGDSRRMQGIDYDMIRLCSNAELLHVDGEIASDFDIISGDVVTDTDSFKGRTVFVEERHENHHYEDDYSVQDEIEFLKKRT